MLKHHLVQYLAKTISSNVKIRGDEPKWQTFNDVAQDELECNTNTPYHFVASTKNKFFFNYFSYYYYHSYFY